MHTSHTAVVERDATYTADFETEPYEAGWASEAHWFVHAHGLGAGSELHIVAQISPDGLHWCDDGDRIPLFISETGMFSFAQAAFGQWLRLRVVVTGDAPHAHVSVTLALKG